PGPASPPDPDHPPQPRSLAGEFAMMELMRRSVEVESSAISQNGSTKLAAQIHPKLGVNCGLILCVIAGGAIACKTAPPAGLEPAA
ncbi:MAG: hypothetical protein LC808_31860, partial [Actinobacteria bacterium]|nr:hypothetical protein [Actinomycetota bacterium]